MGGRFWHTTVASHSSSKMRQVLTFGGCPGAPESHTSGSWPKMANTVLIELGTYSYSIHMHVHVHVHGITCV